MVIVILDMMSTFRFIEDLTKQQIERGKEDEKNRGKRKKRALKKQV